MTIKTAFLPSSNAPFVQLARTKKGRLFRKQVLTYGSFAHPNDPKDKLVVDEALADKLVANFNNGICDIVQVPLVDSNNKHSENPADNIGEVIGVEKTDKGVDVLLDIRDEEKAEKLGKTLLGISAMMHLDYTDTKTGDKVGPTLLHTAITNRPYITGLEDFREVIAASADLEEDEQPVFLTQEAKPMTLEELKKLLKEEHKIDLDDLIAKVDTTPKGVDLSQLAEAIKLAGKAPADEEKLTSDDVVKAIAELATEKIELSGRVGELEKDKATAEIDGLIKEGRVLPKQKEAMVKLSMTDRATFESLLPEKPLISLSEKGALFPDEPPNEELESDIKRLAELANSSRTAKK